MMFGSLLHIVSLRMTDNCVFEEEVAGGPAAKHFLLSLSLFK
jgi:hypothetical protein